MANWVRACEQLINDGIRIAPTREYFIFKLLWNIYVGLLYIQKIHHEFSYRLNSKGELLINK